MDDLTRLPGEAASAGTLTSSGAEWGRFAPGTVFAGRFRIVAPLGRGGMGEVYRADDLKLGQTVALKFLPDNVARDPARLAQFHNEVRVARTISHRNVCRTYDIGDADGRPFLTMEYVDGEDLASHARTQGTHDAALAALASGRTRTALFWYRTSPATLVPSNSSNRPTQGGRPIFFSVLPPWTTAGRMVQAPTSATGRVLTAFSVVIAFAIFAVAALLARRHLRTGRGDRQGAFRTAAVTFVTLLAGFLLGTRVFLDPGVAYERLGLLISVALYVAAYILDLLHCVGALRAAVLGAAGSGRDLLHVPAH
jgi:hypothetical protein